MLCVRIYMFTESPEMWTRAPTPAEEGIVTLRRIFNFPFQEIMVIYPTLLCPFLGKTDEACENFIILVLDASLFHRLLRREEEKVGNHRREI